MGLRLQIPQEGRFLVAVSGGADSVALLCALREEGEARRREAFCTDVAVLHCNFQLRGEESFRDERFVCRLCKELGVPLVVRRFDTRGYAAGHGVSIEMAARELRYAWFEEMRRLSGYDYVCVAHHREDQAETVLLNLLRGTGLRGLAGMRWLNGHVVRPLLGCSRRDVLDYLAHRGQGYVTDSTNLERDALRNRLRLDVMPLLRGINPRAVEHIAEAAERVGEALAGLLPAASADPQSLGELHEWLHPLGFTAAQEAAIWRGRGGRPGAVWESATHRVLRDRGRLVLEEKGDAGVCGWEQRVVETGEPLAFLRRQPLSPEHAYLDADLVRLPLVARHPQRGDRFHPFGMSGSRLVSDFLTDLKLSVFQKQRQWLLCSGESVVWVVGLRSDHRFRVTAGTRRVLCLSVAGGAGGGGCG